LLFIDGKTTGCELADVLHCSAAVAASCVFISFSFAAADLLLILLSALLGCQIIFFINLV
jgi:hypothetical protein